MFILFLKKKKSKDGIMYNFTYLMLQNIVFIVVITKIKNFHYSLFFII